MGNLCRWDSTTGNKSAVRIWLTFGQWRLYWSLGADLGIRPEVLTLQSRKPRPSEKWAWSFSRCLLWKCREKKWKTLESDLLFIVFFGCKLDIELLNYWRVKVSFVSRPCVRRGGWGVIPFFIALNVWKYTKSCKGQSDKTSTSRLAV